MKLLARYLKPFVGILLVCLVLLFGQAACDLSLPTLMSDMVNVGIQQSGLEAGAPEAMRQEGLQLLSAFAGEEDRSLLEQGLLSNPAMNKAFLAGAPLPLAVLLTAAAALGGRLQFQLGCTHDLGQYIILLLPVAMALAVYGLRSWGTGGLALCCLLGLLPAVCYLPGSPLRFLWALWGALPVLWVSLFGVTGVLVAGVRLGAFGARRRNWQLVAAYGAAVLVCLAATFLLQPGQLSMSREDMTWAREIVSHAKLAGMVELDPALMGDMRLELRFTGYDGYMLAVLANYGWLGLALIQAPAAAILISGWRKLRHQASLLGRLLGTAALTVLTWQAAAVLVQNLAGLRGLLTCFPYPFLSDGGTSLVVDCALLGLLLSIFRGESIARDTAAPVPQMPKKEPV